MGTPLNASIGTGAAGTPPSGDIANVVVSGTLSAIGPGLAFCFQGWFNISAWASISTSLQTTAGSLSATAGSGTGIAAGDAINSTVVPPGTTAEAISTNTITLALPTLTLYGVLNSAGQISGLPETTWLLGATVSGPGIPSATTVSSIVQPAVTGGSPSTLLTPGTVQLSADPTILPISNTPQAFTFAISDAALPSATDSAAIFTGAAIEWSGTLQLERSFDGGKTWICCNEGQGGTLANWTAGTPLNMSWNEPEQGVGYRLNCTAYSSGTINYRLSQNAGAAMSLMLGGAAY